MRHVHSKSSVPTGAVRAAEEEPAPAEPDGKESPATLDEPNRRRLGTSCTAAQCGVREPLREDADCTDPGV